MIKKKGSIVPKRFVKSFEKYWQHNIKFGVPVEIVGNIIYPLEGGTVIHIPSGRYCKFKKGKRTYKGCEVYSKMTIDSSRLTEEQWKLTINFMVDNTKFIMRPNAVTFKQEVTCVTRKRTR